ncbi:hypothetical protein Vretimale_12773, partial [Volvox reticuliferus]
LFVPYISCNVLFGSASSYAAVPWPHTCNRCAPSAQRLRMAIRLAAGSSDGFKYMQVYLPPPLNSTIRKAEFIKSSTQFDDCPPADKLPEFALIDMTKFINHYLINDCWYLVDLPGYGFAKAGKSSKEEWLTFTKDYFIKRENLVSVRVAADRLQCTAPGSGQGLR